MPVRIGSNPAIEIRQAGLQRCADVISGQLKALLNLALFRQAIAFDDPPTQPAERAAEHRHETEEHRERATRWPEPPREPRRESFRHQEA